MKLSNTVIGMLHVPALPGTPGAQLGVDELIAWVVSEARTLSGAGFDALLVENMHDRPYQTGSAGPEVTAMMAVIAREVRIQSGLPTGVQILAGANREALAAALAAGLDFIRAEGFVFAHIGDEGLHESSAAALLRYRKQIGAEHIQVFADVKKKHSSHAVTSDVSLAETVRAAEFFLADGVIVTGAATGEAAADADVNEAKNAASSIPVIVGSGVEATDCARLFATADAVIVGSAIKEGGHWANPVDGARAAELMASARPPVQ